MNTKNNKRLRESVEKIERAFIEALQTKELGGITVSDICKTAEVNRSTFYANFSDIYELADRIRQHLEEDVGALYEEERTKTYNSNDFLKLFRHIKDNQLFYRTYFKLGYDHDYKIKLYDVHQAEQYFDNQNIHYHITFFKSGFNAIVKLWLDGGCQESPEEMDAIIRSEYQGRVAQAVEIIP